MLQFLYETNKHFNDGRKKRWGATSRPKGVEEQLRQRIKTKQQDTKSNKQQTDPNKRKN